MSTSDRINVTKNFQPAGIGHWCLLTAFAACIPFLPATWNDFVLYDDPTYVIAEPAVMGGWTLDALVFAFTSVETGNWHPLTLASHITDATLFGHAAWGHHATNVFIHATTSALLFLWLTRVGMRAPNAAVGVLLWAVHPLRVESVAWVSSRKDVLAGLGLACTLLAWERYARAVDDRTRRMTFAGAFGFAALGLMAKPTLVVVPLMLLLVDIWPLKRWPDVSAFRLAIEKIPFAVAGGAVLLVTFKTQTPAVVSLEDIPVSGRLMNACVAVPRYVAKILWPADLIIPYQYPLEGWPHHLVAAGAVMIIIIGALLVSIFRTRPAGFTAYMWFLITLLPVVGLVQVGIASLADRYTYLPTILPTVSVAAAMAGLPSRWNRVSLTVAGLLLSVLGLASVRQTMVWRDTTTLFAHTVAVEPSNGAAWELLARGQLADGDVTAAEVSAREAARTRKWVTSHRILYGRLLARRGDHRAAIEEFVDALTITPESGEAHALLAASLLEVGETRAALSEVERALRGTFPGHGAISVLMRVLDAHGHGDMASPLRALLRRDPKSTGVQAGAQPEP